MIVNGRHKLKFWAEGLVFLFSKWRVLETNLPCKQNEITGIVATPTPKKKRRKNTSRPKAQKGPQQRGEREKKTRRKMLNIILTKLSSLHFFIVSYEGMFRILRTVGQQLNQTRRMAMTTAGRECFQMCGRHREALLSGI
jgi:hypothetical protein